MPDRNASHSEYVDDVVHRSKDLSKLQAFVDHLNGSVGIFRMPFASSEYKMLLPDYSSSKPDLIRLEKHLDEVEI